MKDKIIAKQDEYIKYLLKGILFSNPLRDITKGARDKFESDLSALKAMEGEEVSDEDIMIEADRIKDNVKLFHFDPVSFQYGAQAHRDGLIPASGKAQIKEQKCKRKQDNSDGICPDCGKDHYEGRSV